MMPLHFVIMILALICLVLSAVGVVTQRVNLMALGLALWALATMV